MKKRLLSLLLALIMLLSMAACGDSGSTKSDDDDDDDDASAVTTPSDKTDNGAFGAPVGKPSDRDYYQKNFNTSGSISSTVLADACGIKITVTGIDYSSAYRAQINIEVEKTSGDATGLSLTELSVNGLMVSSYFYASFEESTKVTDTVNLQYKDLLMYGVKDISVMNMKFTYSTADVYGKELGTYQLQTSLYPSYKQNDSFFRDAIVSNNNPAAHAYTLHGQKVGELFSQGGVAVRSATFITYEENYTPDLVLLEVDNTTNKSMEFNLESVAFNGIVFDEYSSIVISPGKKGILEVYSYDMRQSVVRNAYGIDHISSLKAEAAAYNAGEYSPVGKATLDVALDGEASRNVGGTSVYSKEGIEILYKNIVFSGNLNSKEAYILYVVNNASSYDSIKVSTNLSDGAAMKINGTEYSEYVYEKVRKGEYCAIVICLNQTDLTDLGINTAADITSIELKLNITGSNFNDSPTITVNK